MNRMRIAIPVLPGAINLQNYLDALEQLGAEGVATERACDYSDCAGLLLPGGADADPALYGQPNRGSEGINRALDDMQLRALDAFIQSGRPVLGVCRGLQLLNIYLGGTLIQHLPTYRAHSRDEGSDVDKAHATRAEAGSIVAGLYGEAFTVNSNHHQAIDIPGRDLWITQWADDGTIEAAQHRTLPVWGVQFHPERMCFKNYRPDCVDGRRIFEYFLAQCGRQ